MPGSTYVGRFAPSPTGPLHFGSLVAALACFLDARANDGTWLVRIDDLDPPRELSGASDDILRTLEGLHLHWDKSVLFQSTRIDAYRAAASKLMRDGDAFRCRCTRRSLHALGAAIYPGNCREANIGADEPHSIRARVGDAVLRVDDLIQGVATFELGRDVGDFVIWRRDDLCAYQLAASVDDLYQGITHVIRGIDLQESTPRQLWLRQRLGGSTLRFGHIPIAINDAGQKLSKRTGAAAIDPASPSASLFRALVFLQQSPPEALAGDNPASVLAWAIEHWQPDLLQGLKALSANFDEDGTVTYLPDGAPRQV